MLDIDLSGYICYNITMQESDPSGKQPYEPPMVRVISTESSIIPRRDTNTPEANIGQTPEEHDETIIPEIHKVNPKDFVVLRAINASELKRLRNGSADYPQHS